MHVAPHTLPGVARGHEHRRFDAGRAYRKVGPVEPIVVECPYCAGQHAECVTGKVIYPHRADLAHKMFWQCPKCKARVGCHPPASSARGGVGDGTVPLGRLANDELRKVKSIAHGAFDPLFRDGPFTRRDAYAWLAKQLGMSSEQCHMGLFDVADCWRVIEAVNAYEEQQ